MKKIEIQIMCNVSKCQFCKEPATYEIAQGKSWYRACHKCAKKIQKEQKLLQIVNL